jgi:hypothetical protein
MLNFTGMLLLLLQVSAHCHFQEFENLTNQLLKAHTRIDYNLDLHKNSIKSYFKGYVVLCAIIPHITFYQVR